MSAQAPRWPRASGSITFRGETIAKMWSRPGGHECFVHKRSDGWVITHERAGRVLRELKVDSPGDALRISAELQNDVDS